MPAMDGDFQFAVGPPPLQLTEIFDIEVDREPIREIVASTFEP